MSYKELRYTATRFETNYIITSHHITLYEPSHHTKEQNLPTSCHKVLKYMALPNRADNEPPDGSMILFYTIKEFINWKKHPLCIVYFDVLDQF